MKKLNKQGKKEIRNIEKKKVRKRYNGRRKYGNKEGKKERNNE